MPAWLYLFLSNSLILAIGFVVYILITFTVLGNISLNQSTQNLRIFTKTLVNLVAHTPDVTNNIDTFIKTVSKNNPDFRITIINKDGIVLADSIGIPSEMENHLSRPEVISAFGTGEGIDVHESSVFDKKLIYYATEFNYNKQELVVRVSMPTTTSVFFTPGTRFTISIIALSLLFIILLRSFFITKHILKPLEDITDATVQYEQGNFSYRPKIDSPREFAALSTRMGDMATRIETNIHKIASQRDEIEALFNNTTEAIIVFDNTLHILKYNQQAAKLFSIAPNTTQTAIPLISILRNTEIIDFITTPQTEELETILPQTTGISPINVLVRCSLIKEQNRFILSFTDITRLKKLECTRKDFVANVSHELKTPITSIQGFIETLQEGAIDDKEATKKFLAIMGQESKRMNSIISDLLTISRLEQDQTELEKAPINLQELIHSVSACYEDATTHKSISITTNFNTNTPVTIDGNLGLLEQAIGNIVQNAIKYCPEKSAITISTKIKAPITAVPNTENSTVQIVVQDNGLGIPLVAQNRIFERFYRVDKGRSRDQGGTGLGLAISKHIILLHKGTIHCTPRADNQPGACFVISLPIAPLLLR